MIGQSVWLQRRQTNKNHRKVKRPDRSNTLSRFAFNNDMGKVIEIQYSTGSHSDKTYGMWQLVVSGNGA